MDTEVFFEEMPFADLLGIEVTEVADGHAEGRVDTKYLLRRVMNSISLY